MTEIQIPHAISVVNDRSDTPRDILTVTTALPEHSPAGLEADARHEMLKAVANAVGAHRLQGYKIHWNSKA